MFIKNIILINGVFINILRVFLTSVRVLAVVVLVLVVWRGFFALEGCCCSEGCLGGAQVKLVPEDLSDFKSI